MPFVIRLFIGDLAGWALALIILFCLHLRVRLSARPGMAARRRDGLWISAGGTLSLIHAGTIGAVNGTSWLIVAFYLPIVVVGLLA
jgi:hypothetical protein